jgi:hypothetical protein
MIKTILVSACVLACCMGNEYPAKAYDDSWEAMQVRQEMEEIQRQTENQMIELRREIRAEQYRNGYGSF